MSNLRYWAPFVAGITIIALLIYRFLFMPVNAPLAHPLMSHFLPPLALRVIDTHPYPPAKQRFSEDVARVTLEGPALIQLVSSWCHYCMYDEARLATLRAIKKRYALPIILVTWHDDAEGSRRVAARYHGIADAVYWDVTTHSSVEWGVSQVPMLFIIDKEGRVIHVTDSLEDSILEAPLWHRLR